MRPELQKVKAAFASVTNTPACSAACMAFTQLPPRGEQAKTPLPGPRPIVACAFLFSPLQTHTSCILSHNSQMARTRRTIQPPHVLPGHSLRQTPWANPHIWDAADLPAQWPPESSPVHDIDQVRTTPWGLQGRYHCEHKPGDHEYIWLPSFFRDLGPAWNPGLRMERTIRGRWVRDHIVRKNTGSMSAYRYVLASCPGPTARNSQRLRYSNG